MRIAFFVGAFPVVSETFILNQITGLIDRGHTVDIYTRSVRRLASPHPQIDRYRLLDHTHLLNNSTLGVPEQAAKAITLLARKWAWAKPSTWSMLSRIQKAWEMSRMIPRLGLLEISMTQQSDGPYDIIHCQYGTLGKHLLSLKKAGLVSGKFVTSFRGHDITQHANSAPGFYDELFAEGELFLPVSRSLEQRLVDGGCDPAKIRVLHSGIDCSRFSFHPRAVEDKQTTNILTIGRLVEMKGIIYGVEAVASLIKADRKVHYDIIGDGPMRDAISTKINQLNMEAQITLHGWQNQDSVASCLDRAHILLTPSVTAENGETEGIPNVAKEAMAVGLPVVSTVHSGIPELVEDGVSGFLVPERDAQALTDRLADLMDHPEWWEPMGCAGRKKIEEDFDSEKINDCLVALYQTTP